MFFVSCGLNVNIFYVKYLTRDSTDLSYGVKMTSIFTDSAKGSQTFQQHCMCVYCVYLCTYIEIHKHSIYLENIYMYILI